MARRPPPAAPDGEIWGYVVWGLVAVVIAVPELWAIFGDPPWPTISATIGHLEKLHPWVALVVVGVIVFLAADAVSRLRTRSASGGPMSPSEVACELGLTPRGRMVMTGSAADVRTMTGLDWWIYFGVSVLAVVLAMVLPYGGDDPWTKGYVIYGLIGVLFVLVPNALAAFFARDVPFPTLVQTVANIWFRSPALFMVVLALVVILLLHLAFYPWPNVVRPVTPGSG